MSGAPSGRALGASLFRLAFGMARGTPSRIHPPGRRTRSTRPGRGGRRGLLRTDPGDDSPGGSTRANPPVERFHRTAFRKTPIGRLARRARVGAAGARRARRRRNRIHACGRQPLPDGGARIARIVWLLYRRRTRPDRESYSRLAGIAVPVAFPKRGRFGWVFAWRR